MSFDSIVTKTTNIKSCTSLPEIKVNYITTTKSNDEEPGKDMKFIIFNDLVGDNIVKWSYSHFECCLVSNEDTPILKNKWQDILIDQNKNGTLLQSLAFKSREEIDFKKNICDIYFNITLKGDSAFWIILRSNSFLYDESAVLKFYKENKSQRVFAAFGIYVNNHLNGKPYFKVFLKQQIINFSKKQKASKTFGE